MSQIKGKRFFKSKTLSAVMRDIPHETKDIETRLQHLLTQLTVVLKAEEMESNMQNSMALQSGDLRSTIEEHCSPHEIFRPAFNAPMLPGKVHLDFETKDAPEASFKSQVIISTSPRHVTVARGASTTGVQFPLHGVSGMAGVGKTIALIGLGHDDDIMSHFRQGVLFMRAGATATVRHLTSELCKIMRVTSASTSADEVKSSKSLADAVSNAAVCFHGKRILFLINDIWPSSYRPEGYLPELEGLLEGSPESHIAISTRSVHVAAVGGSHVDFGARDPYGPISVAIFMTHAAPKLDHNDKHLEAARGILTLCFGLPISLSIAGAAVSVRMNSGLEFDQACRMYFDQISDEMALYPGTQFLENAIRLSLATLEAESEKDGYGVRESTPHSVSNLYGSLCVLENQQFAPVPAEYI